MSNVRFVGLDVHKNSITLAIADSSTAPAESLATLPWSEDRLIAQLRKLALHGPLKICYEAGPTGYGLQRALAAAGFECVVVAPSLVPQSSGDRVKTDRRDARKLAHFLRSGDLTPVWAPDERTEAVRDLVRSRDDARIAARRIKQQLLKFLLRHGRRYTEGKDHWTKIHLDWVRRQRFGQEAQERVLADALTTLDQAEARLKRLDEDLSECVAGWSRETLVKNLQAFRGVRQLTATALAAEIGDFTRFAAAGQFMAFVGLVPSENSSGQSRRQGGLTKTGNRHVRRLLIESGWQYDGGRVVVSKELAKRREGVPAEVVEIADRALRRLRKKAARMRERRMLPTKIAAALARELAGFLWAAACVTEKRGERNRTEREGLTGRGSGPDAQKRRPRRTRPVSVRPRKRPAAAGVPE